MEDVSTRVSATSEMVSVMDDALQQRALRNGNGQKVTALKANAAVFVMEAQRTTSTDSEILSEPAENREARSPDYRLRRLLEMMNEPTDW